MRGRTESAQATDRCPAPRYPGSRRRPRRLGGIAGLRAAERAPRPGPDRSALRAKGRVRAAGRAALREAFAKWPTGSYLLWYPVKSRRATDELARHVAGVAGAGATPGKSLRLEFSVAPPAAETGLTSAGVLIVNPPWTLPAELEGNPSRAGKAARPGRRRPVQAGDAQALADYLLRIGGAAEKSDLSRRQFAANRIMLRPLGLALRSASANGCGGVTRPQIFPGGSGFAV